MDFDTAVEELTFHRGSNPRIDDPRWDKGFLQTLRPYSGSLDREAWAGVIDCVDAVAHHLTTAQALDRSVVSSLWAIVHIGRAWGLHPDGMLARNDLITVEDQATLADWLDSLSERILHMLGCEHDPSASH